MVNRDRPPKELVKLNLEYSLIKKNTIESRNQNNIKMT